MTREQLVVEHVKWMEAVDNAGGWSSAYFAAKQLEAVCREAAHRGMSLHNPFPIKTDL